MAYLIAPPYGVPAKALNPFFNASSNFSQTLGTPKKYVGFTSFKVIANVPYNAVGSAK